MNIESVEQAETNHGTLMCAQTNAAQAARVVSLWSWPAIPDQFIPEALVIPKSTWNKLKTDGDTPPLFELGRRLFVLTNDLRAWLDTKAEAGAPGAKIRRQALIAARDLIDAP
jgi:hypothetical protein